MINGRQYIAFSGYAGLRTLFPGTIYSARNRKIIKMAIGALGIKNMVRNGGIITFCITVPLTILECYLNDHHSLATFVGNLSSDLIKIGIPALMASLFGMAVGTVTTIAAAPIATVIVVGIFTGAILNYFDDRYGSTERLIESLDKFVKELPVNMEMVQKSMARAPHEIERSIIWRTLGMDIDNPLR